MILHNEKETKLFYNWLLISFGMIILMIIVGGLTRLTNSGLSITEWELFKGILPPMSNKDWDDYFLLYKQIPQYKLLNNTMTLNEFKIIFYWEYFHRVLGRIIGLFFLIPLIYFHYKKIIPKHYLKNCYLIMLLIIFQGFIGWFMVKSGLVNNVTVSHYRLSLHLIIAFIIISIIFWTLLNVKSKEKKIFIKKDKNNLIFYSLFALLFSQIVIGAFVSGLDAGSIYQTWPLMNTTYFPDDYTLNKFKDFFNFENHSLVQFYHRNIAYFIVLYLAFLGFYIFKNKLYKLIKSYYAVVFFLILQILLGIFTLISGLNILLASLHQIFGLFLILSTINLYYSFTN